ncbi:MAG: bis(5'-nucleosyl)-tetraphosphatase (symmetrical) YqeK [Clostridia bacterium]|nr:bis(5'-nucleosyl)-tetraphosphatase (symmetrical) YqeK [Clostridia bacterium]
MNYDWEFIKATVKVFQKEKRYNHTLGVAKEALELGKIFLPKKADKLYFAGLLHDITKDFNTEKQLEMCKKFGVSVPLSIAPKLLHSKTGAHFARDIFSDEYVDDEVFGGIFYHTTGRAKMSLFEIIIYLADYIEEGRTFEDCVYLREFFYGRINSAKSIDDKLEILRKTMVLSFDLTIKNLIAENKQIDGDTISSRNYFLTNTIKLEN